MAIISEAGGQSAWSDANHDAAGNMIGVPKPSAMTGKYTCTYDAWNRLVEVKDGATVVARSRSVAGDPTEKRACGQGT